MSSSVLCILVLLASTDALHIAAHGGGFSTHGGGFSYCGGTMRGRRTRRCTALAPSGIDGYPLATQAALFSATFLGISSAAYASATTYERLRPPRVALTTRVWDYWESFSAVLLGCVFLTAGRSHFMVPEAFEAIYPPQGTWGFWVLPGDAKFHVAWTGVAEVLGGAGLLTGGILNVLGPERPSTGGLLRASARCVALLVFCVTPANFYMLSHGATMPGVLEGPLPMSWHAGRFVAQASILSVLFTLGLARSPTDTVLDTQTDE